MSEAKKDSTASNATKGIISAETQSKEPGITDVLKKHQCDEFFSCEWSLLCDLGKNCCCISHSTR
ncbi:MAG: hypothetical protein ACI4VN_01415 [Clostridia bacterium]